MIILFNGLRFGISTRGFWDTRASTCVAVRFKLGSWRLRPEDTIAADRQSDSAVINCYRINDVPAHRRPRSWHPFGLPGSCTRYTSLSCGRASSEDEPRSDNQTSDIDFGNFTPLLRYYFSRINALVPAPATRWHTRVRLAASKIYILYKMEITATCPSLD